MTDKTTILAWKLPYSQMCPHQPSSLQHRVQSAWILLFILLMSLALSGCNMLTVTPDTTSDLLPTTILSTDNAPALNELTAIEFIKVIPGERGSGTFPLVQNILWRAQAFRTAGRRFLIQLPATSPSSQFNSAQLLFQSTPNSGSQPLGMLGAGGSTTCNAASFAYSISASSITIRSVGATLVACDPLRMTIEHLYFSGLPRATSYTVEGDILTIFL